MLGRSFDDLDPDHAGLGARSAGVRVDRDAAHPVGLEQDRVREVAERLGVVAGALRCNAKPFGACERDDGRDVLGGLGDSDRGGPLVDREVPGQTGLVPVGVAGADDVARRSWRGAAAGRARAG